MARHLADSAARRHVYGFTRIGGVGYGTLFKVSPTGIVTTLHTFTGGADGANPGAALIEAAGGALFDTTVNGGGSGGVIFRLGTTLGGAVRGDFDGDGFADLSLFRPSTSNVFIADRRPV